jgi:hypothetical protein
MVAASLPGSPVTSADPAERRFVLHDVPWWTYVALRDALDHPGVRMTYLKGTLELMSPWAQILSRGSASIAARCASSDACRSWATLFLDGFSSSSTLRCRMKRRSESSPPAGSTPKSAADSSGSSWRPNPYAKRISAKGRRLLAIRALVAELGPEIAILAPDLADAFPDSKTVNAALRAVLEASKTVHKPAAPKRRRRAA